MKTTVNIFRTLLLAVLTLTFGACGEDSLLAELGLDGQTSTKVDGAGEVWDGTVAENFAGGSGTVEDPYQIANGAQLAHFASMVNGGQTGINGKLTADILLNDISNWENWNESTEGLNSWTPIGSEANPFTGTLDGDGHSVSGIYINSTANYQGLVGILGKWWNPAKLGRKGKLYQRWRQGRRRVRRELRHREQLLQHRQRNRQQPGRRPVWNELRHRDQLLQHRQRNRF